MPSIQHYIAANRFAYGAEPANIAAMGQQPLNWLLTQLQPASLTQLKKQSQDVWTSQYSMQQYELYNKQKRQAEKMVVGDGKIQGDKNKTAPINRQQLQDNIVAATELTLQQAIHSDIPFYWHLVDFFSNHFSISGGNLLMRALVPTFDIEAIAPNILGNFADLLIAAESHPAMLYYLNNVQSIGPNTRYAKKRSNKGLNENLGREILELHTLGVKSTYSQTDVTELAKGITGWSIGSLKAQEKRGFMFRELWHEPGSRHILGKSYPQQGLEQGRAILRDLANHPDTARHIAFKLAQHFISDEPDLTMVDKMVATWLSSQGHLPSVITSMLQHPAAWLETNKKFKTPRELVISVCRSCGIKTMRPNLIRSLTTLGQQPFNAGSPAGYKDVAEAWSGPSAMLNRIEWSTYVSRSIKKDPQELAILALGPLLRKSTLQHIKQAESKEQALTLLLMSPEFQRR